jgi:AcrR family transcriptional regulator
MYPYTKMYSKMGARVLRSRMSRKRLTREDSRDQTTQRLLDAAQKLIAKKGLSAASVEDIAAAAGYTRGAFYSNFNSKGDLFIELLRRDHEKTHAQLGALRSDALPLDLIQQRTRELYGSLYRDNESFMNWTEARMLAARDTKFRAKLNALLAEKRGQIAEFIEYFYQRAGVEAPVPPAAMAMGFMALVEGVKLSMLSSPTDMTSATAESVLTLFIEAIMELARLQGAQQGIERDTEQTASDAA